MMHDESRDIQHRHGEMTSWQDLVSGEKPGNDGASCPQAVFTLRVHGPNVQSGALDVRSHNVLVQNVYDSGNPFLSILKKAVTVKMRADVTTNLCTNKLKARNNLGGSPAAPS